MRHEEPTLDGMPEPPPAWVRPEHAVRMPAQDLDRMLAAALPHTVDDDDMPVLATVLLEVDDGLLTTLATDRFTAIRERRPIDQGCDPFTFMLRRDDAGSLRVLLKSLLRGMKEEERDAEPVDLALEHTPDGPTLRVLGHDLDVRFTQADHGVLEFPDVERLVDRHLQLLDEHPAATFPVTLNPTLLGRLVPAQRAGRGSTPFRFRCARIPDRTNAPVIAEPHWDDDDLVVLLMPVTEVQLPQAGA